MRLRQAQARQYDAMMNAKVASARSAPSGAAAPAMAPPAAQREAMDMDDAEQSPGRLAWHDIAATPRRSSTSAQARPSRASTAT